MGKERRNRYASRRSSWSYTAVPQEAAWDFRALHQQIMRGSREFDREERLLLLLSRLPRLCGPPFEALPAAGGGGGGRRPMKRLK